MSPNPTKGTFVGQFVKLVLLTALFPLLWLLISAAVATIWCERCYLPIYNQLSAANKKCTCLEKPPPEKKPKLIAFYISRALPYLILMVILRGSIFILFFLFMLAISGVIYALGLLPAMAFFSWFGALRMRRSLVTVKVKELENVIKMDSILMTRAEL